MGDGTMNLTDDICRVAIDAQFLPGGQIGGVETQLIALVRALGQLEGPEHYLLVCPPQHPNWLKDYMGPNKQIKIGPSYNARRLVKGMFGKAWPKVWEVGQQIWMQVARRVNPHRVPPGWVWHSNGFFESLGVSVVHVFIQKYVLTSVPTIFNPHDLLHEHFPHFFSPQVLSRRKYVYREACRAAAAIVAGSRYTKEDVIDYYQISPEKVWVIPAGPAIAAYEPVTDEVCREVAQKYNLVEPFIFYPAVTWEHKNHLRLLEAIYILREAGIKVNLICTGVKYEPIWSRIQRFITEHQLFGQVRFLGYVSNKELQALYRLCQFVIAPSLFEQASGPMIEAWHEDVPVATSNVTSLPDQAGNAALLFDPFSVEAISDAIRRISTDAELRDDLRERGRRRLQDFSWERTAKAYRALYRYVAHWPMTDEDRHLLGWDWMREPQRSTRNTKHSGVHNGVDRP
jgi:glycosyltransferase involved in cell wall biosynthesis